MKDDYRKSLPGLQSGRPPFLGVNVHAGLRRGNEGHAELGDEKKQEGHGQKAERAPRKHAARAQVNVNEVG